jgi:SAM-dependent methyltransferase
MMDRPGFFDHHAVTWDANRHPDEDARLARVVALAEVQPGHAVLDVGTGTGVLISHLLLAVGSTGRIVALDLSSEMLEVARQKGFPPSVNFLEADVHHVPLPDADFDRVICNAALPHFEDRAQSIREMVRVLRPEGILVISHPIGREAVNRLHRDVGGPVEEDRVPPPEAMIALLEEAGLTQMSMNLCSTWPEAEGRVSPEVVDNTPAVPYNACNLQSPVCWGNARPTTKRRQATLASHLAGAALSAAGAQCGRDSPAPAASHVSCCADTKPRALRYGLGKSGRGGTGGQLRSL